MFKFLSDPYLVAAFLAGAISAFFTVVIAVVVIALRLRLRRDERRWDRFVGSWRPALLGAMVEPGAAPLPPLAPRQAVLFMRLWAYLHESVRGESARRLNDAARLLGVDVTARKLLRRGSRADKLLAILSVGHLRDALARDDLLALAAHPDAVLSVNAARALIQIDAPAGARQLMPLILAREDWDVARVAGLLVEARETFAALLVQDIPQLATTQLVRALRLGCALRLALPPATLRFLLDPSRPAAVVAEALRLADNAELADEVRRCLYADDPRVREQAARQLASLGGPADVALLAGLLDDAIWPVRLAAVQALVALPFMDQRQLDALRQSGSASEPIFLHVLAQRELA